MGPLDMCMNTKGKTCLEMCSKLVLSDRGSALKVLSHGRGSAPPPTWVSRHIHPWDCPGPHSTLLMPPAHKGHFGRNIYHPHFMRKKNRCLAFERSNMWAWVLPVICSDLGPHCAAVTQNHGFLEQAGQVCSPRGPWTRHARLILWAAHLSSSQCS